MTNSLRVEYTKWDGSLHWHFDLLDAGEDEYGRWGVLPPGSGYRRGSEPERVDPYGFVVVVPRGAWWSALFNAVPRGSSGTLIYVDMNTPARWDGATAHLIDLDLDVTRGADGAVRLLDEDEFIDHSARYGYPPDVIDQTRTTAAALYAAVDRRDEPFGVTGPSRVASTLGWVQATLVAGHGAASGLNEDTRFPGGTLAMQAPHFAAVGVDLSRFHHGTLNLIAPFELEPSAPQTRIESLEWKPGYPPETFEFFDATIVADGRAYESLVYRPDPATKPEFVQPQGVIEVLAPFIPGLDAGSVVSLKVDPSQARFVG